MWHTNHAFRTSISALATTLLLAACGGGGSGGGSSTSDSNSNDVDFDRQALLKNLGENVIFPTYQSFETNASALATNIESYCNALGGENEASALEQAQAAWKTAMNDWQQAEMTQFGPLANGGGQLRNNIYSWPLVNTCSVDQEVIAAEASDYSINNRAVDRRGLDALEYILFSETLNHTCAANITAVSGWNDRTEADRKTARCNYALLAAQDVANQANSLVDAWSTQGGNFLSELTNAGNGSVTYASQQEALNAITDALFYLDTVVKDEKLAKPAGIIGSNNSCSENPCPADVESPHAHYSRENTLNNLKMFQAIFMGNLSGQSAGIGFDDYLTEAGGASTAEEMSSDLQQAIDAVEAVSPSFAGAATGEAQSLKAAHEAVKQVSDDLKTQFLLLLSLDVPDQAAGDAD